MLRLKLLKYMQQNQLRLKYSLLGLTLLLWASLASSCTQPYQKELAEGVDQPPDFSIEFFVQGPPANPSRQQQRSYYILEPNRKLGIALGHRAQLNCYPKYYVKISPSQFDDILELVRLNHLNAEPTSPTAQKQIDQSRNALLSQATSQSPTPAIYHVTITAWGIANRYQTTAKESPPTAELLRKLIFLTGGKLAKKSS